LEIDAFRLFVDDRALSWQNEKAAAYFASLSPEFQNELIGGVMYAITTGLVKTLKQDG
jgi:hypothetical protein